MYNMDISIFGYKFNIEVLILIGVIYLILVGHTVCGCCNFGIMEGFDGSGNTLTDSQKIKLIGGPNLNICDSNFGFTSTLSLDEKYKFKKGEMDEKLYHLLTDKKTFTIQNIKFYDYNAAIDLFLDKYRGKLLSMKYV